MMKKIFTVLFAALALFGFVEVASAASQIDAATTTAITTGWTDLKDTLLAIMGVAWPFVLGIAAVLAGPTLVKKMFKLATH